MYMKHVHLFLILAAFFFLLVGTSEKAQASIDIEWNYALFKFNQDTVYWEIYYDIHENSLKPIGTASGKNQVQALVHLTINKGSSLWYDNAWRVQDVFADSNQAARGILDKVALLAEPGKYHVLFRVQDLNEKTNMDSVLKDIEINSFPDNRVALSDLEFASSISQNPNATHNPFYKNSLIVKPNPSALFSPAAPALFFYVEAYNLMEQIKGSIYKVRYYVCDMNEKPDSLVKAVQYEKKKQADSSVEIGRVNVMALNPGVYYLKFDLIDPANQNKVSIKRKFYVYKPNYAPPKREVQFEKLFAQSRFASMSESEVDQQFDYASYLMTKGRRQIYKKLKTLHSKRRFMFGFWYQLDPTKNTPRNERYEEYQKRIRYANEHFGAFHRSGWKTDRGRVYILYGPPTNVDHFPYNGSRKPYEVWHYNELQGGVIFVFADLNGLKDYRLLHSTLKGEVYNPDYMKIISEF